MAYTAAQLTASGIAFDSFLGTGYTGGVLIGAGVIYYHTTVGGFKAVAGRPAIITRSRAKHAQQPPIAAHNISGAARRRARAGPRDL